LLDLIGCKTEGGDEFYDYLHQNFCKGWCRRDPGINFKSAEVVLEGREQVYKRVVVITNVFDRLRDLYVRELYVCDQRRRRHTASRIAIAANIAFAGGNGCSMTIRKRNSW
jgi:hypothetical protein